ncbi:MAG: hypothetical protein AB7E47_13030 [Desulfovibrionaceae bacterium]
MASTQGVLETVKSACSQQGLRYTSANSSGLSIPFKSPQGRTQVVHVHVLDEERQPGVLIFSPVLKMGKDQILGEVTANHVLEENTRTARGHWAIVALSDMKLLCIQETIRMDRFDPKEFADTVRIVGMLADNMEAKCGTDIF